MNDRTIQTSASFANLAENIISSGLVSDDDMAAAVAVSNGDLPEFARRLTAEGLLTPFQISSLNEGRGDSLRVGNYDILDRLGVGGMGTVFKARHRRMKRIVALKVMASSLSGNPVFVKRFQREVETIAALGHPNIVMAYDADEAEMGHFLVMEFVSGIDLAASVEREGPFSLSRAVNCILQATRGLAYAHAQGIIHRDIKPHNLLRDENGVVKVTDLGLARLNHGCEGPAAGTDVTMAGGIVGTADYMPPEQAFDSSTTDHRADIYSLGCTLHFLLTGKPPFSGPTFMAVLLKHRDAEIPKLSAARPETPPELDDLFRRMLAKNPEQRIQRMSDVLAELEVIAKTITPDETVNTLPANVETSVSITEALPGTDQTNASKRHFDPTMVIEPSSTPISVLIVEPSRVQAIIVKNYLQEQSLSVVGTVVNGSDAIEAVRSLRPKAVISAMHLADISGIELAQQIRSEIKAGAPGFLLITSEADNSESTSMSRLNRVLLLQKPFSSRQMAEALHQVTGSSLVLQPDAASTDFGQRTVETALRSQLRVLIVDDSTAARISVRRVLEGFGFSQFTEVPDGAFAIADAARETYHLIVTDYNMPLMDGRALVSYLKQNEATAAIPIIMVTTETDPQILDPVRKLGVAAIVDKAFPVNVVGPLLDSLF